jgi:hypothetical protein
MQAVARKSPWRQLADKELEDRGIGPAGFKIGLDHGQLIEIRQ